MPPRLKRRALFLLLLILLLLTSTSHADTKYASSTSELASYLTSAPTSSPRTILLTSSYYLVSSPFILLSNQQVSIRPDMTGLVPTLDGNSSTRIFALAPRSALTLTNLILTSGSASSSTPTPSTYYNGSGGGCIAMYGSMDSFTASSLSLVNTSFTNCMTKNSGGAIAVYASDASSLFVSNCTFENNSAPQGNGGDIYIAPCSVNPSCELAALTISYSNFTQSSALYGGSIFANSGAYGGMTITNSVFSQNFANYYGGAILYKDVNDNPLIVYASSFLFNDAGTYGYAIDIDFSFVYPLFPPELEMDNSTLFIQNHQIDGYNSSDLVISAASFSTQVQIVALPNPSSSPSAAPSSLATRSPIPPTNAPTQAPPPSDLNIGLIAAVSVGVTAICVSAALFASWIRQGQSTRDQLVSQTRDQENQHVAFMRNRARVARRPLIVHIGQLLQPGDEHEDCIVCQFDVAPNSIVSKAMLTLSAAGAGLTTPTALATTFVRLQCSHCFHAACIIEWCEVYENETCPTCRTVVAARKPNVHNSSTDESSQGHHTSGSFGRSWRTGSGQQQQGSSHARAGSQVMSRSTSTSNIIIGTGRNSVLRRSSQTLPMPPVSEQGQLMPFIGGDAGEEKPESIV